ncbi:MAG TPA: tetratricopeptide repeat protein, partial [Candidatus Binatia bacterium]|nr:tetratricopeptide repeat protein [Candidatus Binatia bacterium]
LANNAAYCLNELRRYSEAERYCRRAIEINSELHYAYKNLGISLRGQGNLIGAAWAWVDATKANPVDPKAFMFLQELVKEHPDLLARCDWVVEEFAKRRMDPAEGPYSGDWNEKRR